MNQHMRYDEQKRRSLRNKIIAALEDASQNEKELSQFAERIMELIEVAQFAAKGDDGDREGLELKRMANAALTHLDCLPTDLGDRCNTRVE